MDDLFLRRFLTQIEEIYTDSEFNVEKLSDTLGLSRGHLHRKIKDLTGTSPVDFLRNYRLKKAAVLLAILMTWISTEPLHGISSNYSFMTLPWLCFVPGINIGTRKSINQINLGVIFFVAACLGIGIVGTKLGFTQLLAGHIAENMAGIGVNCFLFLMLFLSTLVNLILSPGAMMAVLPAPFASLSLQLGMNPLPSLLTIIYSTDFVFLPHEVPAYLIMFGFGLMTMKDFIKLHLMKIAWFTLLFGLIQIPFWYAMGIIMQ